MTLWTITHKAPLSMGFSWKEYWSGLLYPPPGDLLDPGIRPASLKSPALAGRLFTISITWEADASIYIYIYLYIYICICKSNDVLLTLYIVKSKWHYDVSLQDEEGMLYLRSCLVDAGRMLLFI